MFLLPDSEMRLQCVKGTVKLLPGESLGLSPGLNDTGLGFEATLSFLETKNNNNKNSLPMFFLRQLIQ